MRNKLLYVYDEKKQCVLVSEGKKVVIHAFTSRKVMSKLCFQYGRDFEESKNFIKKLLSIRQKVPILLDVSQKLIFFPVYGIRNENVWISYNKIKKVKAVDSNCKIIFCDGSELLLECQKRSILMQKRRCRKILKLLKEV